MIRVYFDLDGVLINFDEPFEPLVRDLGSREKAWAAITRYRPSWFASLKPMPYSLDLLNIVRNDPNVETMVLTAASNKIPRSYQDKWDSCMKHFNLPKEVVHIVANPWEKANYVKDPSDILIDDNYLNIRDWALCGARGILHRDFKETASLLNAYVNGMKEEYKCPTRNIYIR
jgi:hypothetical protein